MRTIAGRWVGVAVGGVLGLGGSVASALAEPAPVATPAPADPAASVQWIRLGGGEVTLGTPGGTEAERPRKVTVPAFELGRTEVTVAQYTACVGAGACTAPPPGGFRCNLGAPDRAQHPVNCITWDQAQAFARWVGGRLPSEAEWAFAAQGRPPSAWPWGAAPPAAQHVVVRRIEFRLADAKGNEPGTTGDEVTAPVCSKPAGNSPDGLCDLIGNVEEWLADGYGPTGEIPADGTPRLDLPDPPRTGCDKCARLKGRVHRGGSWASGPDALAPTRRDATMPHDPHNTLGFRVARSPR